MLLALTFKSIQRIYPNGVVPFSSFWIIVIYKIIKYTYLRIYRIKIYQDKLLPNIQLILKRLN